MLKFMPVSVSLIFLMVSVLPVMAEENITQHLVCPCECAMIISTCDCPAARQVNTEIIRMKNSGFSENQIYSALQTEYGSGIIAHPDKINNIPLWIPGILSVLLLIFTGYIFSRRPNTSTIPIPGREKYEQQFEEEYSDFVSGLEET